MIERLKTWGLIGFAILSLGLTYRLEIVADQRDDEIKRRLEWEASANSQNAKVQMWEDAADAQTKKVRALEKILAKKLIKSQQDVGAINAIEFPANCELSKNLAFDLIPQLANHGGY